MGYTHCWNCAGRNEKCFGDFSQACAKAFNIFEKRGGAPIAFESDEPDRPPVFSNDHVRFNGVGDDGHETFYIDMYGAPGFCKTGQKPYDTLVVACLCLFEHFTGARVSSDGCAEDWYDGLAIARKVVPACGLPKDITGRGMKKRIVIHLESEVDDSQLRDAVLDGFASFIEYQTGERISLDEDETFVDSK